MTSCEAHPTIARPIARMPRDPQFRMIRESKRARMRWLPRGCSTALVSPNLAAKANGRGFHSVDGTLYNSTMSYYALSIQNLITELSRLPVIGPRSAERIAFFLLKEKPEEAMKLADAVRDVKTRIRHCSICYNLTEREQDPCAICSNPARDHCLVCVVEQPKDLLALESTGLYDGVYHVLLGRIAPLE